jgi:ABC-type multidrug transport system fused ATPase/permease subunit
MFKDFLLYQTMFQAYLGIRIYIAYVFIALATFAEGVGILMLLPLMQKIDLESGQTIKGEETFGFVEQLIFSTVEKSGFEYGLESVLVFVTLAFVMKGFLVFGALSYNAHLSSSFLKEIRKRLSQGYLKMSYQYYTEKDLGYFTNLMNEQARKAVFANECMASFGATFVNFSLLVAIAFFTTWKFGLTILVAGFMILLLFLKLNVLVQDLSRQSSKQETLLTKWTLETLQAFKYLTATGKRNVIGHTISRINEEVSTFHLKHKVVSALTVSLREPVAVFFIVVMILIQVFIFDERLGPLFVSIALFYRGVNALFGCQASWIAMLSNVGSFETIHNELREQNAQETAATYNKQTPSSTNILFKNVSLSYATREDVAIKSLSFNIPENSTVAFVGRSGAGKTSIVDLIALLIKPSAGAIEVGTVDTEQIDAKFWRDQVGYVPQDAVLFDDTIANNISLWSDPNNSIGGSDAIKYAAEKAQILDFIQTLPNGFQTNIGSHGIRLSGGQKQRIAIARELFKKPKLLLLDEATSSLDSESEQAIQKTLFELRGKVTIVLVAHRLSTISNADRIYVMEFGQIIESGGFNELKNNPKSQLNKMINIQRV